MPPTPQRPNPLAAAYGFGGFPLPAYRPVRQGPWRITTHLPGLADGYLATTAIESRVVLSHNRTVWMSTGLLEQESHAWHVHCAQGVVVAAGVGLGMYVYAAAMKPNVDLVIAADLNADVIALMQQATDFDHWPCRNKVRLIEADVLTPDFAAAVARQTGGRAIDYLYADIWPNFPAAEAPAQTADMAHALHPRAAGWWGQELSFGQYRRRTGCPADRDSLHTYFAEVGIPAPPITPGYAAFCRDAMAAHGMGERKSLWQRLGTLWRR